MRVVNLTPHVVRVYQVDRVVASYPPSGCFARLREQVAPDDDLPVEDREVGTVRLPRVRVSYAHEVDDLPDPRDDTAYLVSRVLAAAVDRADLYFPWGEVRDPAGAVIGCRALGKFGSRSRDRRLDA